MNRSNITLNEKDIVTFSDDQELLDEFDLSIEIHSRFDDAKQIKQQILDNQQNIERVNDLMVELDIDNLELFCANAITHKNIVQRLKAELELNKEYQFSEDVGISYAKLKSILEKQA